ncbi:hypothetical protein [Bradyrhizobium sp. LA2.1]|uniref:hypothetical protein n=1 Tax=Bradyrhizobium sp. LA2.1 TaxID=3156376 RepID=UPI00339372A8
MARPVRSQAWSRCAPRAAGSARPGPARSGFASIIRWSKAKRSRRRCAPWSPPTFPTAPPRPLDFRAWTYINADLTVNLSRQPVGEWILLDGESWIGPDGAGLAMSRLADRHGYFGRAVQSLVIEKR